MPLARTRSATLAHSAALDMASSTAYPMAGTSGGAATSYFTDTYSPLHCYSVARQMATGQTQMVEVRETGGGTFAWVGPSGGVLDEAAVAAHCGANLGYVRTIKDTGTAADDAVQTSSGNQAQIYDGSAVIKVNSQPSLKRQSSNSFYVTADTTSKAHPNTAFAVVRNTSQFTGAMMDGSPTNHYMAISGTNGNEVLNSGSTISNTESIPTTQLIYTGLFNGASSKLRRNAVEKASGNAGTSAPTTLYIMRLRGTGSAIEYLQELIFFNDDQTANFSAIETNINDFFGAYVA